MDEIDLDAIDKALAHANKLNEEDKQFLRRELAKRDKEVAELKAALALLREDFAYRTRMDAKALAEFKAENEDLKVRVYEMTGEDLP